MSAGKKFKTLVALSLIFFLAGCGEKKDAGNSSSQPASAPPSATETNRQTFAARGVIKELKPDGKTVVIKHEAIPDYMPAMTMPLEVKHTNELTGLAPGDTISFQLVVTKTDAWMEQLKKLDAPRIEQPPLPPVSIHIMRDVEPLKEGDALPEYHFTNQLGRAVSTSQFKGQALAITFMFTRCPLPNFCPLMSANFGETQDKLLALLPQSGTPTNWHLLTISFDPEFDNSAILKLYAARYHCDPARWDFASGDLAEIQTLADQCGLVVERDPGGGFNHNLRTVVIDAAGRVQKIFIGNEWKSDELVAEMVKAAKTGTQMNNK